MKRFAGFKFVHGLDDLSGFSGSGYLSTKNMEVTHFASSGSISLT